MSAQRLKNNDLQNRLSEMMLELEKLRDENKTLKRVHHREEIALKRLESQDNDVTRLIRNHMEEANTLKDIIKSLKQDNAKFNKTLIDKDEEIRNMKKKNDDLKKILNDKKLLDSAELSKRLELCEKDLSTYKMKCEVSFIKKSLIPRCLRKYW
jgi:chromosome segregation ATPase